MYAIDSFRNKIRQGGACVGPSITFTDPTVTEALAPTADFVWIDTEHNPMSLETVTSHLIAARACSTPAFVRVPTSATGEIKRVLDAGAGGVIVPQVSSVAEAQQVVSDCRYPPAGTRGFGPRRPMDYGRRPLDAYLDQANRDVLVSVQIETAEALNSVEAIAALPGLDCLVLGPMDLSAALGRLGDTGHPEVEAAMDRVIAAAKENDKLVGIGMGAFPDLAQRWVSRGVNWVQLGCDFEYLVNGATELFTNV